MTQGIRTVPQPQPLSSDELERVRDVLMHASHDDLHAALEAQGDGEAVELFASSRSLRELANRFDLALLRSHDFGGRSVIK